MMDGDYATRAMFRPSTGCRGVGSTPEFGAPWLYGAAALTNAARVGGREHWLSDTVGGAVLGYALGPNEVSARWEFQ